jgi:hypothetical protein
LWGVVSIRSTNQIGCGLFDSVALGIVAPADPEVRP